MQNDETDSTHDPIDRALVRAAGTILAHADDRRAWSRFCRERPELVAMLRRVLTSWNGANK